MVKILNIFPEETKSYLPRRSVQANRFRSFDYLNRFTFNQGRHEESYGNRIDIRTFFPLVKLFSQCSTRRKIIWNIILTGYIIQSITDQIHTFNKLSLSSSINRFRLINFLAENLVLYYILLSHQWTLRDSNIIKINRLWSKIKLPPSQFNRKCVSTDRLQMLIIFSVQLIVSTINTSRNFNLFDSRQFSSTIFIIYKVAHYAFGVIMYLGFQFSLLLDITSLLTISFNYVHHLIKVSQKPISLLQIQEIHSIYNDIIHLTKYIAEVLRVFITLVHLLFIFRLSFICYSIATNEYNFDSSILKKFLYFLGLVQILFTTFRMMKVNIAAYSCFNDLYQLTLSTDCVEVDYELSMFIYRVSKNDIGFQFAKSTLIGPNFFSSLSTVLIIIFLAEIWFVQED
ncbi:uncharacterized protein LOC128396082 [Panonychus citri]|uniref:uncharacterized protein LOC128396082 n=1 Tax=Panonychus citri TaxID=50023 RepID=UPI0023077ACC|nr:uncharacterized protein LOC128396082 [Panonychus citri]